MHRAHSKPVVGPDAAIAPPVAAGELKFEVALAELAGIIENMEGGRLPLAESLAAYRRGSELLRHCQQQLADAEREMQILENGSLRDFEPGSGETG
ncbi:MAG TPA: exodeoxyribonuclease VII small subunit [Candidatus Accumulibacter sp.]|nr:exodeoxyribonuclease VII small subunit [Accumulibacter sp.]